MKITEENFSAQIKLGNEDALLYVIKTYGWVINTVVRKHLYRIPWYAEECMNDVLFAVWEHIDRFDSSKGSFQNWLAGVARYTCLNYLRKYHCDAQTETHDESTVYIDKTDLSSALEVEEGFQELIQCLNSRDQMLFTELFKHGESIEQISNRSGVEKSVLYNRVSRGKQKIRNVFRSH